MKTAKLAMRKVAHKRSTFAERTGQNTRAASTLLAAANGHDQHWSHDEIRVALLRRHAVELDDLLAELPRPAISYAVTKGWIHKSAGNSWFRVTKRAAAELKLPARRGDGQKVQFIDGSKLPKSLPAFDEPKPESKPVVGDDRAAELLAAINEPRDVLAQARLYHAVIAETGWKPVEIARRLHTDRREMGLAWDRVMDHLAVLKLEPEYQNAVASGQLSLGGAYDLARAPAAHRAALLAAFQAGESRGAVRQLAKQLKAAS